MISDGRDPAHTCACCGQPLPATGNLTLKVEAIVLDLCNQAFAEAEACGHAHVDVPHLIAVLTRDPDAIAIFWHYHLDHAAIAAASVRWLARMERRTGATDLNASAELKTLLSRAEARAIRDGRIHASLPDIIGLLAELSATTADPSARTPHRAATTTQNSLRQSTPMNGLLTTTQPRYIGGSITATEYIPNTDRQASSADQSPIATLLARLDRQDAELAALRAAVSASASAHSRSSQSVTSRNTGRGQTFDPAIHVLTTQSTSDRIYTRRSQRQRQQLVRRRRNRQSDRQAAADHERHRGSASTRTWSRRRPNASETRERALKAAELERDDDTDMGQSAKRFFLALDDHIERAPSIGPKTAGRLVDAGIATVRELLAADAEAVSGTVRAKFITTQRVRDWQAQARLVCTVPFLRGTHAQLLVGAGYSELDRVVAAEPGILCAAILKFAATRDGQSVLRSAPPPDMERIVRWLQNAAEAEPARAAA